MSKEVEGLKCPSCGGNIVLGDDGKEQTYCPFCGTLLKLDTRSTEQRAYEAFKGRYRAEAEFNEAERKAKQEYENEQYKQAERRARKARMRGRTAGAIGCLTPLLIFIIIAAVVVKFGPGWIEELDSKLVNPSSYIDVSFDGINGKGHVSYSYHDDAPFDSNDIKTYCHDDGSLRNGESVEVRFSPVDDNAMIKEVTKSYKVTGLKGVESDFENFSSGVVEDIEKQSKSDLKNAQGITDERYKALKHQCLYLRYDPDTNTNVVWDVYRVHINSNGTDYGDRYVAVWYENLVVKSNGDLVYDKSGKGGHLMFFKYGESFNGYESFDDFLSIVKNNKISNPQYLQYDFS